MTFRPDLWAASSALELLVHDAEPVHEQRAQDSARVGAPRHVHSGLNGAVAEHVGAERRRYQIVENRYHRGHTARTAGARLRFAVSRGGSQQGQARWSVRQYLHQHLVVIGAHNLGIFPGANGTGDH
jgi:hypothetical protein